MKTVRKAALALSLGLLTCAAIPLVKADSDNATQVVEIPFSTVLDVCGETITTEGTIQGVFHVSTDANGTTHVNLLFHPQGLTGVGVNTGATYHFTGETRQNFDSPVLPVSFTGINNFKLIGDGDAPNYLVHENVHIQINAAGEVTADHDNLSVECR